MRNLLSFNLGRRGRALAALTLAVIALAILLLGIGSELPTALASELPPARPENVTYATAYTIFLPIVYVPSPTVFYDDFSTKDYAWPDIGWSGNCYYKYVTSGDNHYYRMGVKDKDTCIGPNFSIPAQQQGTFIVKVRRYNSSHPVHYGFYFSASSQAAKYHWWVEVRPDDISDCEGSDRPYFWLSWQQGSSSGLINNGHTCTNVINTGQNWNVIEAIRSGNNVQVYLNGERKANYTKAVLTDPSIYAYFDLVVRGLSSDETYVDYDYVKILNTTTP